VNNTTLEDERLKKTLVVIMTVVAVLTLATTAELQNALAATSMTYGSVSYVAHHHTRICGFKAFTQGKCFPRI
jgi:uncharacterized membrane protein